MLSREEIEKIVDLTIARMREKEGGYAKPAPERAAYHTGGNGWMFERAEDAIDAAEADAAFGSRLSSPLGVCLDTCHVWDGGYDIVGDLDGVLERFDAVLGISRLKAIHLNDSLNVRDAHKDRHACIGKGKIGLDALARVINHPTLRDLPFYLETPNDLDGYRAEIALLKSLRN